MTPVFYNLTFTISFVNFEFLVGEELRKKIIIHVWYTLLVYRSKISF